MNNLGEEDGMKEFEYMVGHQIPFPEPYRGKVGNIGEKRGSEMEMKATGRITRRFVGEVIELNAGALSPASIDITLSMTFSTLWTGLQRSEACSYIVGSSPGVCSIEIHTFPSG